MRLWFFVFVSYFLILNGVPCVKSSNRCEELSCCSQSDDQQQSEEDCSACNPLDCSEYLLSNTIAYFFITSTHLTKNTQYSEFIPANATIPIWQPPKNCFNSSS